MSPETVGLEDVLRYGGSRAVASLNESTEWLQCAYASLVRGNNAKHSQCIAEPALTTVCRFLGCRGIVRPGLLAVQAKRSLHPRRRPLPFPVRNSSSVDDDHNPLTISYAEFEELVLRCAATVWDLTGISHGTINIEEVTRRISSGSIDAKLSDFLSFYRDQYKSTKSSNGQDKGVWGIDFVGPYIAVLRHSVDLEIATANDAKYDFTSNQGDKSCFDEVGPLHSGINSSIFSAANVLGFNSSMTQVQTLGVVSEEIECTSPKSSATNVDNTPPKLLKQSLALDRDQKNEFSIELGLQLESVDSDRVSVTRGARGLNIMTIDTPAQLIRASGPDALLAGTKEALWPVYATYCSCGDSIAPGKLSGPNLFTLLSKLDLLTDKTLLSDIGILLHQISAHTNSQKNSAALAAASASEDPFDSPSLSFEEFLVFLCAFAQLRFEGAVSAPIFATRQPGDSYVQQRFDSNVNSADNANDRLPSTADHDNDGWFETWRKFMGSSSAFRRLLEECVLPILSRYALLAFPEDARHRDRYASIFSLEVLLAVEGSETTLRNVFDDERNSPIVEPSVYSAGNGDKNYETANIVECLRRINLVPQVLLEEEVLQLVRDVLPENHRTVRSNNVSPRRGRTIGLFDNQRDRLGELSKAKLLFPQWEWVLCVVAFQTVESAVHQTYQPTNPKKVPKMVAEVVVSMTAAVAGRTTEFEHRHVQVAVDLV